MSSVGTSTLRYWRELRRLSQLELSARADVSAKHISYIETGRSRPSVEMLIHICATLEVPLRARNELLLAAGYAPRYPETNWQADSSSPINTVISTVLNATRFPSAIVDQSWTLIEANVCAHTILNYAAAELLQPPANLIRVMLHPNGLANRIVNFDQYADHIVRRIDRLSSQHANPQLADLLDEFGHLASKQAPTTGPDVFMPMRLRLDYGEVDLISTIATFGSPLEVSVAELAIETLYPADAVSASILQSI